MSEKQIAEIPMTLTKRGLDLETWRVLERSIFPGAQKESVFMAVDYCRARGLDVFKRPVHIVPIWDTEKQCYVDSIWPSIAELRTTAARTGVYAGKDRVEFGPDAFDDLGTLSDFTYPEWAQVTVYKLVGNQRVAFEGDPVYFREIYASKSRKDPTPNDIWRRRPRGQLAKCAEAAALRAAFPEEIGNEYTAEEMEGQSVGRVIDGEAKQEVHASKTDEVKAKLQTGAAVLKEPEFTPAEWDESEPDQA